MRQVLVYVQEAGFRFHGLSAVVFPIINRQEVIHYE